MKNNSELYNEDYFEHGIEKGISCYSNYRWIPELTIPMAMAMIDWLHLSRDAQILDYGCSRGYLVKALRLLHRQAWGCDISKYAIDNCDKDVEQFCFQCYCDKSNSEIIPFNFNFDWCISKDVFEHISVEDLPEVVSLIGQRCQKMFAVIPLGDGNTFNVPAYNKDITHITAQTSDWWADIFVKNGWEVDKFYYSMKGIKDNWADYGFGNGFFILQNNNVLFK